MKTLSCNTAIRFFDIHIYGSKCCMHNSGLRAAVEIATQHKTKPNAVWPIETVPQVPLLLVQHVPFML